MSNLYMSDLVSMVKRLIGVSDKEPKQIADDTIDSVPDDSVDITNDTLGVLRGMVESAIKRRECFKLNDLQVEMVITENSDVRFIEKEGLTALHDIVDLCQNSINTVAKMKGKIRRLKKALRGYRNEELEKKIVQWDRTVRHYECMINEEGKVSCEDVAALRRAVYDLRSVFFTAVTIINAQSAQIVNWRKMVLDQSQMVLGLQESNKNMRKFIKYRDYEIKQAKNTITQHELRGYAQNRKISELLQEIAELKTKERDNEVHD